MVPEILGEFFFSSPSRPGVFMDDSSDLKSEGFKGLVTADLQTDLVKTLGNTEDHFRILMDLLPICLFVHRGGKIIYANPGLVHLLGYDKAEEFIGQSPLFMAPPEIRREIQSRIDNINGPKTNSGPYLEHSAIKKNGQKIFIEAEGIAVVHQGIPAIMVIFRDITARKKIEEALRVSEENLKSIIGQMPDGIVIDTPDRILFVNQSLVRVLGYGNESELLGHSPMVMIHPDFHSLVRVRLNRAFNKEGPNQPLEYEWIKKDGQRLQVESSSVSVQFEGEPAALAVVRDMGFRKLDQEALQKSEENFKTIIREMPEGVLII